MRHIPEGYAPDGLFDYLQGYVRGFVRALFHLPYEWGLTQDHLQRLPLLTGLSAAAGYRYGYIDGQAARYA
jgi:hypothetical protein